MAGEYEPVAVKVLRPDLLDEFIRLSARWAEQAEVLRFVRHPGVVGVREHVEGAPMHPADLTSNSSGRSLYLVMNWVEGQQLRDFVTLGGGSREATLQVLRHLEQIADVLDWLHSGAATPSGRPVVHGDLSTANVMITPSGQAVLVDFGLTRLVAHQTQQAAGTPGYAAPEVWSSGQYSPAGDRYGFGAITYFALTGGHPSFDRAEIHAGFSTNPLLAAAGPQTLDQIMEIFADDPARRPPALRWVRLLRSTATTTRRAPTTARPVPYAPTPLPPPAARRSGRLVTAAGIGAAAVVGLVIGAPGDSICVRTNGEHYAFVTILDPAEPVQLDVVVWERSGSAGRGRG